MGRNLPRPGSNAGLAKNQGPPESEESIALRSLVGARKALRTRADDAAQASYKLREEADGYTEKIDRLLDHYLDTKDAA